ncbi:MAG TPA: hypothetical protein VNR41_04100 [Xanthobacteraceae bacterium]|nr:hypothetical protein [Xanthobacteraceae bacterium]
MASFPNCVPMIFRSRFLLLALLSSIAAMTVEPAPASAQAASEFAPLPAKPSRPKPARVAPAAPPAPVIAPEAAAPVAPAPAAASAPAEPTPVAEPVTPAVAAPTPAEPAPATANVAPAEKVESKTEPDSKPAEPKAAEKEKDKKKKAAEKHEKQDKNHKQAKEHAKEQTKVQAKEKDIPEPKPERVDLKNANKLPADDKGPRAIDFLGGCANNYDKCMAYVNEQAEKIPNGEVCLQGAADQQEVTEKVRKFITLRPAIHGQAANRMVAEALYVIYPCRRAPERTAGRKK